MFVPMVRLLACAAAAAVANPAFSQQYIGEGGTLLDRNTMVGSGGKNTRARDVRDQIWFNNQIITGNAPAGRSFRGYVGYTSPNDFRGLPGSDRQYGFRRDSASASAVATGVRARPFPPPGRARLSLRRPPRERCSAVPVCVDHGPGPAVVPGQHRDPAARLDGRERRHGDGDQRGAAEHIGLPHVALSPADVCGIAHQRRGRRARRVSLDTARSNLAAAEHAVAGAVRDAARSGARSAR